MKINNQIQLDIMSKFLLLIFAFILSVSSTTSPLYAPCSQSSTRTCSYGSNLTDRLLSMKKGGSNVLSTNNYDSEFYLCEEYNYNCGYLQNQNISFLEVANGVQLNLTYPQLLNCVPSDSTLTNQIKPYLGLNSSSGKCVSQVFPLVLTDAQSNTLMTGFLNRLTNNISTYYNAHKSSFSTIWSSLNINIKTAVLEIAKMNMNNNFLGSNFWTNFQFNNWVFMSKELKNNYVNDKCIECLRSAYLIDSVTTRCNKYQSVNFLIDQSGSIGSGPFNYAIEFLKTYVTQTYDDLSIMSIHFFDSTYQPYINYGNNRATILSMLASKSYRGLGTYTGNAINASVLKINAGNFKNGVPKLLVILTDGGSADNVQYAADYARQNGIILFCVGIGANINTAQLQQITNSNSNIVYITDYASLSGLVNLIENYFCKQILDLNLNQVIYGNIVKVPTSPSYFRVKKAPINSKQYYEVEINYATDPTQAGEQVRQSLFDPFPDSFSQNPLTQHYRTSILTKYYYIAPTDYQDVPLKKTITSKQLFGYSYLSIAGNAMNFNISLKPCATLNCTTQRIKAASIGALSYENKKASQSSDNSSIYIPIGVALGALAICTGLSIYGLKKFVDDPQQQLAQLNKNETKECVAEQQMNKQIINDRHQAASQSVSNKSNQKCKNEKKSRKSINRESKQKNDKI